MTRDTWTTIGEWCALVLLVATCVVVGLALAATALGQEYAGGTAIARSAHNPAGTQPELLTPVMGPPTTGDTSRADGRSALTLARCMWAEASGKGATDHAAIAHAVGRQAARSGRTYAEQLDAYCHGLRGGAARVAAETARHPALWVEVQARAAAYFEGTLADPCPGSLHWGGRRIQRDRERMDARIAAGDWEPVRCKQPTANTFLRVKR